MKQLIPRPNYLKILKSWQNKTDIIKIITGIRRSGKSSLFDLYQKFLKENGITENQIQKIDYEEVMPQTELMDWKKLYNYIDSKIISNKMNYIFLDEIQVLSDFQLAINALRKLSNVDLYVTGSNSAIFSSELSTRLAGRYVTIHVLPLSFLEYNSNYPFKNHTIEEQFNNYIHNSGFPYAMQIVDNLNWDLPSIRMLIDGIWNTIIIKDLVERKKIRETNRLNSVIKFIFHNIGNETSINKITNTFKATGIKIESKTIESWIDGLLDAFILYKTNRYNIKGKQILKTNAKYYIADVGLRYFLLGGERDIGHILENVVYLELKRRNYDAIYTGDTNNLEIDFITKKGSSFEYFQVTYSLNDPKTKAREFKALNSIKDHYPKYILTYDRLFEESKNGIKVLNILDWLLT